MKIKQLPFILFALLLSLTIVSCGDGDTEGSGRLNVQLTDAPFPTDLVEEANITITKIEVRQKEGEENGSPFITILEQEVTANLLDLTNGVTANLTSVEIPVGMYDLVRVYISDASITLKTGETYDLTVPSGASSGLKVFIDPSIEVAGGLSAELLLDVNVASSFVPLGPPNNPINGFNFKPVIKASNESFAGRLIGEITTLVEGEPVPVEGAQVSVYVADTLNTTTFSGVEGAYAVLGLDVAIYDVVVEAEGFVSDTIQNVGIIAANATTEDYQLVAE